MLAGACVLVCHLELRETCQVCKSHGISAQLSSAHHVVCMRLHVGLGGLMRAAALLGQALELSSHQPNGRNQRAHARLWLAQLYIATLLTWTYVPLKAIWK